MQQRTDDTPRAPLEQRQVKIEVPLKAYYTQMPPRTDRPPLENEFIPRSKHRKTSSDL